MISTPSNSMLLRHFREFYGEVVRRRAAIVRAAPPPALSGQPGPGDGGAADDPGVAAWHVLRALLDAQAQEAAELGGLFGARVYQEVQYVFAALADEIFLQTEWAGRSAWPLLESSLFHTHSAGETVFDRIDRLLARPESVYADLAAVYFWALSLGFEGKYRGEADRSPLQQYRTRLFQILYRDRPRLLEVHRPLFPESYLHNLDDGAGRRLPNPRLWLAVLAAVLLLWIGLAQVAWVEITGAVDQVACQINPSASGCGGGGQ
ncbi:MAG TPA: DotU family type IV/VI secretion system protein [Terriglobales bacterium]|nr:DotU family type IV/VI secretion system protein [Terriglobales bacterium]